MPTPVIMPKLEMSQETATVVEWLKAEGEAVDKGEPLLTVETDKVTIDIESPAAGTLAGIRVQADDVVPVTEVIAQILQPGESLPARPVADEEVPHSGKHRATPVAQRIAAEHALPLEGIEGTGVSGRITKADVVAAVSKIRGTPAARRLARERGLGLEGIAGSGPRGRIQAADIPVGAGLRTRPPAHINDTTVGAGLRTRPFLGPPLDGNSDVEVVPLAGMRRTIAERMARSAQTAPHITLTVEADMSAAQALRAELNARADAASVPRISVTAILVKACAWALMRHRWVNASLHGGEIHLYRSANIGVAVALDEGLIVPVIHRAEMLGLGEIGARLSDLAERAQQNRLAPADVAGGTFTLSNLGMYRIRQFTAILNPPQSAILAVGSIAKRQIVVEQDGQDVAVIRPMITMTMSADHRVLDGAVAARFLQDLVDVLEHPNLLLW
jgi:pyruvate dehydrogenase E2 component (dihydrolipoamide acetyltransferase)